VVATAATGPETLDALRTWRPDVSVIDVRMPPNQSDEGLRAALAARGEMPGLPVLILSQHVEQLYARELLADGGLGLMAEGLSNRAIGRRLFLSEGASKYTTTPWLDPGGKRGYNLGLAPFSYRTNIPGTLLCTRIWGCRHRSDFTECTGDSMHRSIAAAAAVVALTAALTACNGSDGDGDKAGSTKDTRSSAAAQPSGEKSPEAAPSSASSTGAKLGDTLSLVGIVGLGQSSAPTADVTLNKFVDDAKPTLFEPEDGSRLVAAEFTIVNTGQIAYGDIPYTPPTVIDAAGGEHHGKPGDSEAGKPLGDGMIMNISPGQRATGWVIFDVPKGVKVTSVTFQMDRTGMDTERIGRWTL
jgi:CheY-like chemotaxis protein